MAKMPGATWKPVCNFSRGQIGTVIGMVVHHMVSSEPAAYSHFNTPGSGASAHFGVTYAGEIFQYVDTADAAYHACQANYTGQVGVENESPSGDSPDVWQPLTAQQVSANARILAWLHSAHGVELRVADPGNRRGCGYHSMVPGDCSVAWGQTGCPGDNIINQRAEIVRQAGGAGPAPADIDTGEDDTMLIVKKNSSDIAVICGQHRPRKIKSVNDYQNGTVLALDADAWQQYWDDAIKIYNATVGT